MSELVIASGVVGMCDNRSVLSYARSAALDELPTDSLLTISGSPTDVVITQPASGPTAALPTLLVLLFFVFANVYGLRLILLGESDRVEIHPQVVRYLLTALLSVPLVILLAVCVYEYRKAVKPLVIRANLEGIVFQHAGSPARIKFSDIEVIHIRKGARFLGLVSATGSLGVIVKPLSVTMTLLAHRDLQEVRCVSQLMINAIGQGVAVTEGWS